MSKNLSEFIEQLWQKHKPSVLERLAKLERTIAGLLENKISTEELQDAIRQAHRLAGSLGSYGLPKGSEIARTLEMILESGRFDSSSLLGLSSQVVELRALVDAGPVTQRAETLDQQQPASALQPSILLVEDDELLQDLLVQSFALRNLKIMSYRDGESALEALTSGRNAVRPHVLILDIDLPGVSGMTILRSLAESGEAKKIKIIMLTARNSEAEVMESLRLGAIDHISKPFSLPILMEKVLRALQ